MSDGPPKTLSSRFQALSCLQPAEPPRRRENATGRGCRRPRPPRRQKDRFSPPNRRNKQSRIVLLAPLPDERKPAIGSQACNALNPRPAVIYSRHFTRTSEASTPCRLRFSSPTSPRTPARFSASAPAWTWPPISSSRPAFRSPTGISAGREWTISTMSPSPATTPGQNSSNGVTRRATGWCCSRPREPAPIWITVTGRTISCCSGGSPPASPTRSSPPPMRGW